MTRMLAPMPRHVVALLAFPLFPLFPLAGCVAPPAATPAGGTSRTSAPAEVETTKAEPTRATADDVTVSFPTPAPDAPVEWTGIPMVSADGAMIAIAQTRRPTPFCEVGGALFAPVATANPVTGEWFPFFIGTGCNETASKQDVNARLTEGKFKHLTLHTGWPAIQMGPVAVKIVAATKAFTVSLKANDQPTATVSAVRTGTGAPSASAATTGGLVFVSLDAKDAPTTIVALPTTKN